MSEAASVTDTNLRKNAGSSSRNAPRCPECNLALEPGAPVFSRRILRGYLRLLPTCEACKLREDEKYKQWASLQPKFHPPRPCQACGRPVHRPLRLRMPKWIFCSKQCSVRGWSAYQSRKRKEQRGERTCEECGEAFVPVRTDAKFCSIRCKQRAYRHRVTANNEFRN